MQLPPFAPFPVLSTSRIQLDELSANDAVFMQEIMYYNGKAAADELEAIEMITRILAEYDQGLCISWVLRKKDDNETIGTIGFYRGFNDSQGEVGYILKPEYRRKGYMAEALETIKRFGLGYMELDAVLAFTRPENTDSRALLNRCGFETDGTVGENGYIRYRYSD